MSARRDIGFCFNAGRHTIHGAAEPYPGGYQASSCGLWTITVGDVLPSPVGLIGYWCRHGRCVTARENWLCPTPPVPPVHEDEERTQ